MYFCTLHCYTLITHIIFSPRVIATSNINMIHHKVLLIKITMLPNLRQLDRFRFLHIFSTSSNMILMHPYITNTMVPYQLTHKIKVGLLIHRQRLYLFHYHFQLDMFPMERIHHQRDNNSNHNRVGKKYLVECHQIFNSNKQIIPVLFIPL